MKGLKYISTPRGRHKRGGGAALVANISKFDLDKIATPIPKPLEVVWGLLRPKQKSVSIRKIICCAFYSPPQSKNKGKLLDHIITTTLHLMTVHDDCGL